MEKKKPTHNLARFREVAVHDGIRITLSAIRGAAELGYGKKDLLSTIQLMERKHFYKSMTSIHDHTQWQDVYHVPVTEDQIIYIKFTDDIVFEFHLLSFKEK